VLPAEEGQDGGTTAEVQRQPEGATPLCIAFFLCDRAIIDATDKTLTAVRIVDTAIMPPNAAPEAGEVLVLGETKVVLLVKPVGGGGRYELQLHSEGPNGGGGPVGIVPEVDITGAPEAGARLVGPLVFHWDGLGLYWLRALLNGAEIARTPFRITKAEDTSVGAADAGSEISQLDPDPTDN